VSVAVENHDHQRRTPKANPVKEKKKLKSNGVELDWNSTLVFKSCSELIMKLMKHKFGWVFNKPVDVKGLGLHDYNTIVKHRMDLGTVKTRMDKNWYKSPREFAEDVRLSFSNAMLYNPKGQDVHFMAEQLSKVFEDQWKAVEAGFNRIRRIEMGHDADLPTPTSRKTPILARKLKWVVMQTCQHQLQERLQCCQHPLQKEMSIGCDAGLPTPTSKKTPMLARAGNGSCVQVCQHPLQERLQCWLQLLAPAPAPAQAQAPSPPLLLHQWR
jgi:hypothetical protein